MKCSGDSREATYMIYNGKAFEPHCKSCLAEAIDSTVPVPVMSMDAYERMIRDAKSKIA